MNNELEKELESHKNNLTNKVQSLKNKCNVEGMTGGVYLRKLACLLLEDIVSAANIIYDNYLGMVIKKDDERSV